MAVFSSSGFDGVCGGLPCGGDSGGDCGGFVFGGDSGYFIIIALLFINRMAIVQSAYHN